MNRTQLLNLQHYSLLEMNRITFLSDHVCRVKGSIGYIPTEYGMGGQVSILGDIYSYGILLLEMFTGKRPTDDIFKHDLNIHQFTDMALPDHVMDIVDPSLLLEIDDEDDDDRSCNDIRERPITRYQDLPQVNARRFQ